MSRLHICLLLAVTIISKPRVAENLCAQRSDENKRECQSKPGVVSFPEILQAQQEIRCYIHHGEDQSNKSADPPESRKRHRFDIRDKLGVHPRLCGSVILF